MGSSRASEECAYGAPRDPSLQLAVMPNTIKIMPSPLPSRNRRVAALLYERLCPFEFGIAAEVFGLPRPEMGKDWYRFTTCTEAPRQPLRANGGLKVMAEAGLGALRDVGTIIIPGWHTDQKPPTPALRKALWTAHEHGARLVT